MRAWLLVEMFWFVDDTDALRGSSYKLKQLILIQNQI
jgi:hypothetical protein